MAQSKEYLTVVVATIKVHINSERKLTESEVQEMMSEASYEIGGTFGDVSEQFVMDDHSVAYVCNTEWVETETTKNSELFH